jgi:hypothetical protein
VRGHAWVASPARGSSLGSSVKGKRTDLKPVGDDGRAYGVKAAVAPRAWHTVRVDFRGQDFVVRLDRDAATFTVRDDTLKQPGRVGVWSKADSVTEFEEFVYASSGA